MNDGAGGLIELRCGAIAAGGGCVARADDGRVVFVRHSLPGELVRARITSETSSYLRADAIDIVEASADRVDPPCRFAGPGRCGGCDWQHVALPAQRELKSAHLTEQLHRIAGVERHVEVEEVPGAPRGLGWRTRVRYAVNAAGQVGLHRHRSHDVEIVDRCLIASAAVQTVGVEGLRWPGAEAVEVIATEPEERRRSDRAGAGRAPSVVIVTPGSAGIAKRDLARTGPPHTGLVVGDETLRPPRGLRADVAGRTYRITAGAFWQIHRGAPPVLAGAVISGLQPRRGEHAVDLFAGVGLFSVVLGEAVGLHGSVLAVERHEGACADARHNARDLPQVVVREGDVTPELVANLARADVVVLDPPRQGAGRQVMAALVALTPVPRRIAYVACDPASFARDLRVATDAGWSLGTLRAFDQFPMTEHIEIVAMLEPPARTGGTKVASDDVGITTGHP